MIGNFVGGGIIEELVILLPILPQAIIGVSKQQINNSFAVGNRAVIAVEYFKYGGVLYVAGFSAQEQ